MLPHQRVEEDSEHLVEHADHLQDESRVIQRDLGRSRAISGDLGRVISGDLGRSRCSQALSLASRFSILTMCLDKSDERAVAAAFDALVAHAEAGDVGVGPAEVRALRSKFCSS